MQKKQIIVFDYCQFLGAAQARPMDYGSPMTVSPCFYTQLGFNSLARF